MRQVLTHAAQMGRIIAGRRRALKLSQRALAAKLAISQNRLSEIEADTSTLPLERLLEISNLLGLDLTIQNRQPKRSAKDDW
jgi:HTH-type transcriptional regulator/antitoxin HipB